MFLHFFDKIEYDVKYITKKTLYIFTVSCVSEKNKIIK